MQVTVLNYFCFANILRGTFKLTASCYFYLSTYYVASSILRFQFCTGHI